MRFLVSHDHFDHCDIATLRALNQKHQPLVVTGLGMKPILKEAGITKVTELDW